MSNGIWLCQSCGKLIDTDVSLFTVDLLKRWKKEAEDRAFAALAAPGASATQLALISKTLDEHDAAFLRDLSLSAGDRVEVVTERMRAAAKLDVAAFRGTRIWQHHAIELDLVYSTYQRKRAISLAGIANAVGVFSTLSLVSPPGTGKSTSLVQLAEELVERQGAIPILMPLGEWSGTGEDFFEFLTRRNAFRSFRHQHFQQLAFYGRLVLLIDGWNEVDAPTRIQAQRQLEALRRDFPLLSAVIATRRQAVGPPGEIVEIKLLNKDQQLEIARRFNAGNREPTLSQAWRVEGIRELVSIPLYLTALLDSTQDGSFPKTKEEVLGAFVARHEKSPDKAEVLRKELFGCHKDMLVGLAVEAIKLSSVAILDEKARFAVSQTCERLRSDGQISTCPQPSAVLDVLIDTHALVRSETGSVSFQHQQFQEWYASFEVERTMLMVARGDTAATKVLRTEMLNWPTWEESILFACERLSRKDAAGAEAVGATILTALGIDPMLSAEMIYRSDESVWFQIEDKVIAFANRWHKPGIVDRGLRFMMTTGRPEFASQIWPFVANSNGQIYLTAIRAPVRFRPSVLGTEIVKRLCELPDDIRGEIVSAIVDESGFDGLELGALVAKVDPNPKVVVQIVRALEFRGADQHINNVLESAHDQVWETLAAEGFETSLVEPSQKARMAKFRAEIITKDPDPVRSLYRLVERLPREDHIAEQISKLVEAEKFPAKSESAARVLERAFESYPDHVKLGLLNRLQAGLQMPYSAMEFLSNVPAVDDGPLVAAALDKNTPHDKARLVFAIVGSNTVGHLMDELVLVHKEIELKGQQLDEPTRKEYWRLMDAVAATRKESFVKALLERGGSDEPQRIRLMAELIVRHGRSEGGPLAHNNDHRESLATMVEHWISVLLTSSKANRHQMAEVAAAVTRLPLPRFVAGLHRMLERDLTEWARAREEFKQSPPTCPISPDVTHCWAPQYQRAFVAIGNDEVVALMTHYLPDLRFGVEAANVLNAIWHKNNDANKDRRWGAWRDFSDVEPKRRARQDDRTTLPTSDFAEKLFATVRQLVSEKSDNSSLRHAIRLATIGLKMPHGAKRGDIDKLLALPFPFSAKYPLLAAAVEAGEVVKADDLVAGIEELLEAAKREPWRLDDNSGELMGWVELVPFSDRPSAVIEILNKLPKRHREPWNLDRLLLALADSPADTAVQVLKALADRDRKILENNRWAAAALKIGNEHALSLMIDLIRVGALEDRNSFSTKRLAELSQKYPRIHAALLTSYASLPLGKPLLLLEAILRETPDGEIILAFIRSYAQHKRRFDGNLAYSIRETAIARRSNPQWPNAYSEFGLSLATLRKELFAIATSAAAESTLAEECLIQIDELRDEYGRMNDEPRHPDITSDRPWPKEAVKS